MKVVCAWCRATIVRPGRADTAGAGTTHGICPSCIENFSFHDGGSLGRFLDCLEQPVIAVDGECRTQAANTKACEVLGRTRESIQKEFLGDVFSCAHSRLPEGCGRTIHCSGCTIRRAVSKTYETGEPQVSVPATLTPANASEATEIAMKITTVKADGMVLLRVDDLQG